jgi:FMN-dependent oxidoreductase (nitrilotriacetate monooxygenase family)
MASVTPSLACSNQNGETPQRNEGVDTHALMTQHPINTELSAGARLAGHLASKNLAADSAMSQSNIIHLAADLSFLHTDYLWRMPGSWIGYDYYSTSEFYEDIARIAQRGVMDMLFFGDTGGTPEDYGGSYEAGVRYGAKWPRHDMAPMIPLMAKAASGVGFAITMSTTYHHPFYVARFFNALDHVTRGRIAWNAVTSAYKNEAANYGFDVMMDHDERYRRAQEFLEVACKLWDSVEKDAIVTDRETGIFADPAKVHRIDHRGRYFNVRGPLPALPSPQQRPVIIQAGLSGPGMDLAATYADMQFSTRRTVASMQQHRAALDAKLAQVGRKPRDVGILWSIRIQVAESDAAAKEKERQYLESIRPEAGLVEMSAQYNVDFSKARPGMRLADFADEVRAQKGNYGSFEELLKTTDPSQTVEEFGRRFLVDRILVAAGTPKAIVDKLEEMHVATGANGGFILGRGYSAMDNIREFVEFVVPELQRRGLSKRKYTGATLRENLS